MFFTLLIPAWNCETTINRLLDSVVAQHEPDLNVIVVDDSDSEHQGLYENYIKAYEDKLNIKYYPRRNELYTNHCPGNTRHDAMLRVPEDTEYILFADCDDNFIPDMFSKVKKFILENNKPDMIFSAFDEYNGKTLQVQNFHDDIAWLHGNFYKKEFLDRNNINFKVDLASHEDIFFNILVQNFLSVEQKDITVFPEKIYQWYSRDESESHRAVALYNSKYQFIETHLGDFLRSAIEPNLILIERYPETSEAFLLRSCAGLLTGYFYFQGSLYQGHYLKENYDYIKYWVNEIIQNFHISIESIIMILYSNLDLYTNTREESKRSIGNFAETESLRDFLLNMKLYT